MQGRVAEGHAPFRVVASDMDGTLLNEQYQLSDYTKETLRQLLVSRNTCFVFATGRHYRCVQDARVDLLNYLVSHCPALGDGESLDFPVYVISSNGARIHDMTGRLIVEHNLSSRVVRELCEQVGLLPAVCPGAGSPRFDEEELVSRHASEEAPMDTDGEGGGDFASPVSISAYTTEEWFTTSLVSSPENLKEKFGIVPRVAALPISGRATSGNRILDDFPVEGVGKVSFQSRDRGLLRQMEDAIVGRFGTAVSVAFSSNTCLDVMSGGVSKASGLQEVIALLSPAAGPIAMKDVVAFGDSMNDREMLLAVGKGYVMGNGQKRLKESLPQHEVIGTNQDSGVAKKLRELFALTL